MTNEKNYKDLRNYDGFRILFGDCASDKTVFVAGTAVNTLEEIGVPEDITIYLIRAIQEWEAQRYQKREATIRQLEKDALSADCRKMMCEE
jgi:hypothetical protein